MASAGPGLTSQAAALIQRMKTFTNNALKDVCKQERLLVSGTKNVLQKRVADHLNLLAASNDSEGFYRARTAIAKHAPNMPAHPSHNTNAQSSSYAYSQSNGHSRPSYGGAAVPAARAVAYTSKMTFKDSPFISRQQLLSPPMPLPGQQNGKGTNTQQFIIGQEIEQKMKADKDLRVFIYGAPDNSLNTYSMIDVAFPQHIEVRVNGDEIKHNYKGLKNKPGSTKPVDITSFVRKSANYKNSLQVTYAYTDKKWYFEIHLVKKHPVEQLARKVETHARFSKEMVIRDMQRKADDPDIVATSSVMSLKDPVAGSRIKIPCRSTVCTHNSCFDINFFLQLQEQAPTWTCPLCNKAVSYEALAIDGYVQDILNRTSDSVDQVTIEPDGHWSAGTQETQGSKTNGKQPARQYDDDSDEDLVEISHPSAARVKNEYFEKPSNAIFSSPPISNRTSAAPGSGSGSNKRAHEVIDLTFSSDDEVAPPPKRPQYNTPSSNQGLPDPFQNGTGRTSSYSNTLAQHSRPSLSNGMNYGYRPHQSSTPPQYPAPSRHPTQGYSDYQNSSYHESSGWR